MTEFLKKRLNRTLLLTLWLLLSTLMVNAQTITGTASVCTGSTATLSGTPAGGTWSSANLAIATVSASGVVSGTSSGTTLITYDIGTGYAITTVTVNPSPSPIIGPLSFCAGTTTSLTAATPGGTWSSSSPVIATISTTGVVTGVSSGTATATYTLASGCISTAVLTVNPLPGSITGTAVICTGKSTTLSDSPAGGTWSSSDPTIVTIGSAGVATGISAGTATISYTLSTGCTSIKVATINPTPGILGSATLCSGATTTLSSTIMGGIWTSSSTSIAMFTSSTSGILTGVSAGIVAVTYALPTGCSATRFDTVLLSPNAITGPGTVCVGASVTLSNTIGGGSWTSSATTVATAGVTSGIVSGITAGTTQITYTLSTGCYRTTTETVNPTPAAITGSGMICIGSPTTLSNTTAGGTWSSSSSAIATVGISSGIITAVSPGTATISYTLGTGCYTTRTVTVTATPSAGSTPGSIALCTGSTTTVSSTVSGGSWSSSTAAVATIGATSGIVNGISAGTAMLTYSVSNSCGTAIATTIVTVGSTPAITGISPACVGLTSTLSVASGCGTWSSGSTSVATVSTISTGAAVITGIAAGTATISFASCTGCIATTIVTITAAPPAISGASAVCAGSAIVLDDSVAGGTWSSSNPAVAEISVVGSSPGTVSGIAAGTAIMTYWLSSGCTTTLTVTVHALPVVAASATPASCGGAYIVTATGGTSYSWLPTAGTSCSACATTTITPTTSAIYTVTGSNSFGCTNTATVSINGNRITGHISFSGAAPAVSDCKVWLIQYNSSDSSIVAMDSTLTCLDGTQPYYRFDSKPAGNYFVKARLLSSVPGTSDYIPTYGNSSAHWNTATTITHGAAADTRDISMMYGTVLSGPGFINGHIYAGAGKGTAGVAMSGMLVYLKNVVTGVILNYTYTDAAGGYSFGGLPYGNYFVYPEEYGYYTTPSSILSVTPSATTVTASFKKHTDYGTITPDNLSWVGLSSIAQNTWSIYPNPCEGVLNISLEKPINGNAGIIITDITGRTVHTQDISNTTGSNISLQLHHLQSGLYILSIETSNGKFTSKFTIQ